MVNKMDAIYVRFPDNDFSSTVEAFVKAIAPRVLLPFENSTNYWCNITKTQVVELFNETAFSLYSLYQNSFPYKNYKHINNSYFKLEEKYVYFGLDEFKTFTNFNNDGCLAYLSRSKKIGEIVYQIV